MQPAGADPGFRRGGGGGSYIQKGGGGRTFRRGGGGVRTGISGADPNCCRALGKSTSKKKLQTAVGGGGDDQKKTPVSAPGQSRAGMEVKTLQIKFPENFLPLGLA